VITDYIHHGLTMRGEIPDSGIRLNLTRKGARYLRAFVDIPSRYQFQPITFKHARASPIATAEGQISLKQCSNFVVCALK
jgi:hypothetical protein